MKKLLVALAVFFGITLYADTPPPVTILQMRPGSAVGLINSPGAPSALNSIAPGAANNVLQSNGTIWTSVSSSIALNSMLPSQTGLSGYALFTNGTNPFWGIASGSGTVTSVSSGDGSLDITNPNTTVDARVHWPLIAGAAGDATNPAISWGGSGIYQPSYGLLAISTLGVERLRFENNAQATFYGDFNITGNLSAANFPQTITGNPSTIAWFDSGTGILGSLPQWNVSADNSLNFAQNGDQTGYTQMLNLYSNGNITGDFSGLLLNRDTGTISGNVNFLSLTSTSPIGGGFNVINSYVNAATTGEYRSMILGNDGTVGGFATGVQNNQNGAVTKGYTGFGSYTNSNIGDGSGVNAIGFDASFQNGTVNGGIFGFNFNNSDAVLGNNNNFGLNINNQPTATGYGFFGVNVYNRADFSESIVLLNASNDTADARTLSGAQVFISGNITNDIHGFNLNMNPFTAESGQGINANMTGSVTQSFTGFNLDVSNVTTSSTSSHIQGLQVAGGTNQIFGDWTPFSSANVEIGNGFFSNTHVNSGSPLTGTDTLLQIIQSNLLADDDISTGPFGLDTNMLGLVSQVAVGSGKTIPWLRSALLGTSIPQGSGGTITKHSVLTLLGLPSFGGSVSNPTRMGIEDGQLLGQNFCDGATDCWMIKVNDPNAKVSSASGFQLSTATAQPTCDVAHRGTFWNIEGGAGVADQLQICQKDAADNYNWVNLP